MSGISLYGELDRDAKGNIKSQYPAWYNSSHLEELEETLREMETRLDRGMVPSDSVPEHKQEMKRIEKKVRSIKDSSPVLTPEERDQLADVRKRLGFQISLLYFTKTEMDKGTADVSEEAKRMSTPMIKIEDDKVASVLKACGVDNFHGCNMITRGQAEKAWKLCSKQLGETSNTETLRKK